MNFGPFRDQKWCFEESTLSFIRYFGDQDLSKFNFRAVWVDRKVVRHFHQIEIIPNTIRKRSMQFETKISKGTAFRPKGAFSMNSQRSDVDSGVKRSIYIDRYRDLRGCSGTYRKKLPPPIDLRVCRRLGNLLKSIKN